MVGQVIKRNAFHSLYTLQTGIYSQYLIELKIWSVLWTAASYPMGTRGSFLSVKSAGE
jgi:hypothetical protein